MTTVNVVPVTSFRALQKSQRYERVLIAT